MDGRVSLWFSLSLVSNIRPSVSEWIILEVRTYDLLIPLSLSGCRSLEKALKAREMAAVNASMGASSSQPFLAMQSVSYSNITPHVSNILGE